MPQDWRTLTLLVLCVWQLGTCGCQKQSETVSIDSTPNTHSQSNNVESMLGKAKQLLHAEQLDHAAETAYQALVKEPQNLEVTLVASEIEVARGNSQTAIDLVGTIPSEHHLGARAVQIWACELAKLGKRNDAADLVLNHIDNHAIEDSLLHSAWDWLNLCGRREEASRIASMLCRHGTITRDELLSLISRTDAFPRYDASSQDAQKHFSAGLGFARWQFTQNEFRAALETLQPQYMSGFESPAACALYGRMLAETQSFEQFAAWHSKCDEDTKKLGDYWAALGAFFLDQREFEAAARGLLEAVFRNTTDRASVKRLAIVFDELERSDEAAQFRFRELELASTEVLAKDSSGVKEKSSRHIARKLISLTRPFEALQWSLESLSTSQSAKRQQLLQQRLQLQENSKTADLAANAALIWLDPTEFELDSAVKTYLHSSVTSVPKPPRIEVLGKPRLTNVAEQRNLVFQWYQDLEIDLHAIPIHESIGGGIAVLDYDLDGWPDVYFAQGSGEPPTDQCTRSNTFFRNVQGNFRQVTPASGCEDTNYSSGIAAGDVNQDGFIDLYLGSLGRNRLLINNGDGTFRDATSSTNVSADHFTSSLAIADINGDGLPDLFEANYIAMAGAFAIPKIDGSGRPVLPSPLLHDAATDRWFENLGDGTFSSHEIEREVAKPGTSLGIVITDFDSDGKNDVFVGNDVRPNHLLTQQGGNQFRDLAGLKGVATGYTGAANGCMGIATGDFNRDGKIDMHITNFYNESANLFLQTASNGFADFPVRYGIDSLSTPYVGFGTKAIDIDRNGWLDLLISNGHIFDLTHQGQDYLMPPQCLMRTGSRFEVIEPDDESGYWMQTYLGRSMAYFDFDCDNDLDILIGHLDQPIALLQNDTMDTGRYIQFELVGTSSERDAIGTRLIVQTGREQFTNWVTAGDGYLCSDQPVIDVGIARHETVDGVVVHWPSGEVQTFSDLSINNRYLLIEGQPEAIVR